MIKLSDLTPDELRVFAEKQFGAFGQGFINMFIKWWETEDEQLKKNLGWVDSDDD